MPITHVVCPDCDSLDQTDRRQFLKRLGAAAAAVTLAGRASPGLAAERTGPSPTSKAETAVKALYHSLSDQQRKVICFDWDHLDARRGLLRTYVANNWHITEPTIDGDFFTRKQRQLVYDVFKGIFNPDWHARFVKQLKDDTGGQPWGAAQNIAIFGRPGEDQFQFVMTGRHMTIRADGNSENHVAFGGPIFHGHAAESFNEKPDHPGNIFWPQAVLANDVCGMLDGKQRERALVEHTPEESDIAFAKQPQGIPVADLSRDQKDALDKVLRSLLDPYRQEDRDEVLASLKKNGGLEACHLAFFKEGDIGDDGVWDNWRIEGPAITWYFRGSPHVHIWIHVADDPRVKVNEKV